MRLNTVGAQSIACAQSIAHSQIDDNIGKKNKIFEKLFSQKIKRVIQQQIHQESPILLREMVSDAQSITRAQSIAPFDFSAKKVHLD